MYNGPNRKIQRLQGFDYSNNGYYFITICTKNRENYFGNVVDSNMILNDYGKIAENEILKTQQIRKEITINEYIIMPNHLHLLILIDNNDYSSLNKLSSQGSDHNDSLLSITKNTLSNSIQRIKSSITSNIRKQHNDFTFSWQKSFYDAIVTNDVQLNRIIQYIVENPSKWQLDINNLYGL
ncbi:MAG: transposase [Candidatus Absconditabacteria bacterium]